MVNALCVIVRCANVIESISLKTGCMRMNCCLQLEDKDILLEGVQYMNDMKLFFDFSF